MPYFASANRTHYQTIVPEQTYLLIWVCTRDRLNELKLCINSLFHQLPADGSVQLVISDTSIDPDTEIFFRENQFKYLTYTSSKGPFSGTSACRNRSMLMSTEYLLFIDDDCLVSPNFINTVISFLNTENPDVFTGKVFDLIPFQHVNRYRGIIDFQSIDANGVCIFLPGLYTGIRAGLFNELGGFDDSIGPGTAVRYGEDTSLGERILNSGFSISVCLDASMHHIFRHIDLRAIWKFRYQMGRCLFENLPVEQRKYHHIWIRGLKSVWNGFVESVKLIGKDSPARVLTNLLFYLGYGIGVLNPVRKSRK